MRMLILILTFGFCLPAAQAQKIQFDKLFGKTWQVDEFYADSVRVDNADISSLQFAFQSTNQFTMSGVDPGGQFSSGSGSWAINPQHTRLTLTPNGGGAPSVFEITHLDENVFAFVIRAVNPTSGDPLIFEFRLQRAKEGKKDVKHDDKH